MPGWLFTVLTLLVLLLAWRGIVIVQRYHRTDYGNRWLNWLEGLNRLFCLKFHRLEHDPLELPDTGPALVIANHLSGLDALLLIAISNRPLRFMIAREHYNWPGFTWLFRAVGCIPVDRAGRPEKALREAIAALAHGEVVALFPHGRIHLPDDPPQRLKGGAARLALHANCSLYPAKIEGVVGAGHILPALVVRGHARVRVYPPIDPAGKSHAELMQRMEQLLNTA
ncbi:MAG: lysophospholipid acyltransferase family protein [Anaerolineales bacterium]